MFSVLVLANEHLDLWPELHARARSLTNDLVGNTRISDKQFPFAGGSPGQTAEACPIVYDMLRHKPDDPEA